MLIIPLSFSITAGIAFGCIGLSVVSLATGRARARHARLHSLAAAFVLRYVWLVA